MAETTQLPEPLTAPYATGGARLIIEMHQQKDELINIFEEDVEHGRSHLERLRAWYECFASQEANTDNIDFATIRNEAALHAITYHDWLEVAYGHKNKHREAGAMWGFILDTLVEQNFDQYKELIGTKLTKKQWIKKKYMTAFAALYHQPEGMPTVAEIKANGLFNIEKLATALEEYFTQDDTKDSGLIQIYSNMKNVIDQLKSETPPDFSDQQLEQIRRSAYMVAMADKLDQLAPVQLSSNRMFTLMEDRPFYNKQQSGEYEQWLKEKGMGNNIEAEFEYRRTKGREDVTPDDLTRIIFEMTRMGTMVENLPEDLKAIYCYYLRQKNYFIFDAIKVAIGVTPDGIVENDVTGNNAYQNFLSGFAEERRKVKNSLDQSSVPIPRDRENYKNSSPTWFLYQQARKLRRILENKKKIHQLSKYDRQHIYELLQQAMKYMEKILPASQTEVTIPYSTYYPTRIHREL